MKGQDQVSNAEEAPGIFTFEAFVKRGSRRLSLHYYQARTEVLPVRASTKPDKTARPVLSLDWVEIADSPAQRAIENGSRVFIAEPGKGTTEEQAARKIFASFASRAYRRPATGSETETLLKYFRQARQGGAAFDEAIGLGLKAALASPYFLFRVEGSGTAKTAYRLNGYELASRLSYFLWMSMPDEPLLQLARQGKLRQPQMLEAQVRRMLQDPKSNALVEQFFGQWLGYSEFARAGGPDRKIFPVYTDSLGEAMVAESTRFFGSLMREDRSLLQLLDADYTFANEELARLYGIEGVRGRAMQRVSLTDRNRGGVLGMGSILAATSLPNRTSPVVRGKWLLEVMLGEKLPPPPANAGDLPEPSKETASLTLRQRFELHRKAEQCASCHSRIDPMGYGLENFDAVGRWRDKDNGQPVDSEGVLRTGERFRGPAELKNILLARKEQFARTLSERILKFALGRELRYFDEPAAEQIAKAMMAGGWRPGALVSAVVKSYPFQYQQQAPGEESTE
ncbi:MAG: DUF1592 domain-containing protein, partial [Bryobacteraceae bacterium]